MDIAPSYKGMNAEEFDRFIDVLGDENTPKGSGQLGDSDRGFCCLGVHEHYIAWTDMDSVVPVWLLTLELPVMTRRCISEITGVKVATNNLIEHFTQDQRTVLARLNDQSSTFAPIIAYLIEHREEFVIR